METKIYIKNCNDFKELENNELFSRKYFYYYNIFMSIKLEFDRVNQILPKYIVFGETLMPNTLIVYIYRNELKPEDLVNYFSNYFSIKEGLDLQANANSNDEFIIKFYLL